MGKPRSDETKAGFQKGKSGNPAGKKPGTKNKVNNQVWEDMLWVFKKLGGKKHVLDCVKHDKELQMVFLREIWRRAPQQLDVGLSGSIKAVFQWEKDDGREDNNGPV